MTCELCIIFLTKQESPDKPFSLLEDLKASSKEGCDGCQLVVESIEHFFQEELLQELQPDYRWEVKPAWFLAPPWRRGPGAFSLVETSSPREGAGPDAFEVGRVQVYHATIYLYCTPEESSQSMDIPIQRHTSQDTSSHFAFQLAKDWLDNCCTTHKECADPLLTTLPKRTIFVGSNNSEICLREIEGDEIGRYACLSHCWGNIQPLKTTSQNIAAHKTRLPWDALPKTFQDAISFCRSLGIKYVWIDSLCIVQDDDDDWGSESAKMGTIYTGAIFTIAAMASKDGRGGCFRTDNRKRLEFSLADAVFGHIKVFATPGSHEDEVRRVVFPNLEPHLPKEALEKESPLRDRGWALQEILLSRRIIYFHKYEIAWECRKELRCECRVESTLQRSGGLCRLPWEVIVDDYSGRSLSKGRDKLPALSGTAHSFKRGFPFWDLGKYYAGLWESNLLDQLAWRGYGGWLSRSPEYRAPTWSWASVDGKCHYYPLFNDASEFAPPIYRAEISSVSCTIATIDPYGQVSGGYLDLITLVLPATYHDWFGIKMITNEPDALKSIHFYGVSIDVNPYHTRRRPFYPDLRCAILRYGKEGQWGHSGHVFRLTVLLLETSGVDQQCYKRIGVATGHLGRKQWRFLKSLLNSHSRTIRII